MKLNPNKVKTRDVLMVKLLTGSTKAGVKQDKRKQQNKLACRSKKYND